MTFTSKTKYQYTFTASESTTPVINFGLAALVLNAVQNLGTVTLYGSVDGINFALIKNSSNANVTRTCGANSIHRISDDIRGIPFIKIVSSTGGKGRLTVVHD